MTLYPRGAGCLPRTCWLISQPVWETVKAVLDRLPKRYEDRRRFDSFPVQAGSGALCLRGTVIDSRVRRFGGRKQFYEVVVVEGGDGILTTSKITCRWFNMPWMKNTLAAGHEVILYGKPKEYQGGIVIDHPDFEIVDDGSDESIHLERIVPIYKASAECRRGVNGRMFTLC